MNKQEVYEFLKESNVFYLATIDGDRPRVRPFGALNIYEDKNLKKILMENILFNKLYIISFIIYAIIIKK